MEITKIEPNWYHHYANAPQIVVHVDERIRHSDFIYDSLPDPTARRDTMLISKNLAPWIKFVMIDDPDGSPTMHGALGGDYRMTDGSVFHSRTGWSSRAGVINSHPDYRSYLDDEIVEVTLKEPGQLSGWAGYYVYASFLRDHPAWAEACKRDDGPLYLVRDDSDYLPPEIYHIISVHPDKVVKADRI